MVVVDREERLTPGAVMLTKKMRRMLIVGGFKTILINVLTTTGGGIYMGDGGICICMCL